MVHVRELESHLRAIRTNSMSAIDEETGKVDQHTIDEQAQALKRWIADLETAYVEEAKRKPVDSNKIGAEGRKLVEEAWFAYEIMLEVEQRSGEPPRPAEYEQLPSGIVTGEARVAMLSALRDLTNHFAEFRRNVLKG
ncbi:TPA: hypothetical protein H1005_03220 [archaeon]|uniref:Uncharacterized protein n=1 Tax=Candidatus Naiadarchaeum limnaeum TaxID=2756139 RepID=A0A832V2W5_9ARCH|nr:hypothetical protein [Candidatus Naiadarchaeales archaeon SRR2090153.bin1042]HIK00012.1 hypothetical protein [Candidatus Naiadarchaeum limnaeum]